MDATITVGLQDAVAFVIEPGTRDASYVLTHDRAIVLRLARTLLAGMSPAERRVSA